MCPASPSYTDQANSAAIQLSADRTATTTCESIASSFSAQPSGRGGSLQRLSPRCLPLYVEHLLRLDSDDRFRRFGRVMSDDAIRANVRKLRTARDAILGVFVTQPAGALAIVAAVHMSPLVDREGRGVCELSFSVDASHRRCGLARTLMRAAQQWGRIDGVSRYVAIVEPSNRPMNGFARSAGMHEADECFVWDDEAGLPLLTPFRKANDVRALFSGASASPHALLIHGAGGAAWQWRSHAMPSLIARGYCVVAPELEAADDAEPIASQYGCAASIEAQTRACLRALDGQPPALIVSHSMGCIVAARIASIYESSQLVFANAMPADGLSGQEIEASAKALACRTAQAEFRAVADYLPTPHLRNRLVVVHGVHDRVSPLAYSQRTLTYHANGEAQFEGVDTGHLAIKSSAFSRLLFDKVA